MKSIVYDTHIQPEMGLDARITILATIIDATAEIFTNPRHIGVLHAYVPMGAISNSYCYACKPYIFLFSV